MLSARATAEPALLAQARTLLRTTDALRLADGSTLPVDDSALASRLAADDASLADLDARITLADAAASSHVTGTAVADRLREVTRPQPAPAANDPGLLGLFAVLIAQVLSFVGRGTLSAIDPRYLIPAVGTLGLAVALLVFAILGRGLRERIRREALAGDVRVGAAEDPSAHLRLADSAIAAGRARDALHELYLFALAILAAHETIRFDPALTDRELLARAAAIPQIASLRALVALHERAWFGLKPADLADAARARELAERLAA
ncbi:MAG TPA: DUF4129 domain-containing protein [Candidatus Limnocylindria bacterium]|nr:DUF4129 domain-containing protein [Candidatus Limnocylindria bacterium]